MATSSFFKSFVVIDEKAIEQFLYDLENAKPVQIKSPKKKNNQALMKF